MANHVNVLAWAFDVAAKREVATGAGVSLLVRAMHKHLVPLDLAVVCCAGVGVERGEAEQSPVEIAVAHLVDLVGLVGLACRDLEQPVAGMLWGVQVSACGLTNAYASR